MELEDPDKLPLIERINKAEHLARELCEHLQQAFLPKLADLRSLSKKLDPDEVSDQTMYDNMAAVVKAETYSDDLFMKLSLYLQSIRKDAGEALGINAAIPERPQPRALVDIQDVVLEDQL